MSDDFDIPQGDEPLDPEHDPFLTPGDLDEDPALPEDEVDAKKKPFSDEDY